MQSSSLTSQISQLCLWVHSCIDVGSCYVSNAGFKQIVNKFPRLRSLGVSRNNFTSKMLEGCHSQFFRSIVSLDISTNVLDDRFFEDLYQLQPKLDSLQVLFISRNDISDKGIA